MIYSLGERCLVTADEDYFIAPDAQVIGSVRLGRGASVWFGCVLRADEDYIMVGDGANVQDGTVIHTDRGTATEICANVTIGHRVLLHSCYVAEGSLIANGAMLLNRVRVGKNCLIAAGSLVPPDKQIPDGSVMMGSPAKLVRSVSERDLAMMKRAAEIYQSRQREYRRNLRVDSRNGSPSA